MASHIVKVQIPLFPVNGPAMVYAKHRKHQTLQTITRETVEAIGSKFKGYFRATWDGQAWKIGAKVPDQNW